MARPETQILIQSPSKLAAIIIKCYGANPPTSGKFSFSAEALVAKATESYGEDTARKMAASPAVWAAATIYKKTIGRRQYAFTPVGISYFGNIVLGIAN